MINDTGLLAAFLVWRTPVLSSFTQAATQLQFSRTTPVKRGPCNGCRHFELVTYANLSWHTLAFVLTSTGCFGSQTAGGEREIQNITNRRNSRRVCFAY